MESLYTKYRPAVFQDVVGQTHVVSTLQNAVLEHKIGHAYLFCGPRGTGKTTMARLFAKALLCTSPQNGLPCGVCETCKNIAQGIHPDVFELDAASRTGVDNVREEIIDRVNYAPLKGAYKIYIIDEVHMLTASAFNALLKTLEEPPSHVVFILCTTEPHKILATILSRVMRFDFHRIKGDEMFAHLQKVCTLEHFSADDEALKLIVEHAQGGMRDALSSLEQISVFGKGVISKRLVEDMLGATSQTNLTALVQSLALRDTKRLFEEIASLCEQGKSIVQAACELAEYTRDVYLAKTLMESRLALDDYAELFTCGVATSQLEADAQAFKNVRHIAYVLNVVVDMISHIKTAANPRLTFELYSCRMIHPVVTNSSPALIKRLEAVETQLAQLTSGYLQQSGASTAHAPVQHEARVQPAQKVSVQQSGYQPLQQPAQPPAPQHVQQRVQQMPQQPAQPPAPQPVQQRAQQMPQQPAQPPIQARKPQPAQQPSQATAAPMSQGTADKSQLQRMWKQTVDKLMEVNPSRGSLLTNAEIRSDDGVRLVIELPIGSSFATKMLAEPSISALVQSCVAPIFGNRKLVYAESSLQQTNIARAQAAQTPATTPVAAPTPTPAITSAPGSAPAPAPAPAPAAAPVPTPSVAPAPAPQPKGVSTPTAKPMQPAAPQNAIPSAQSVSNSAASARAHEKTVAPETASSSSPTPSSQEQDPQHAIPRKATRAQTQKILDMLTEAFGEGVKPRMETRETSE
ncbi:DNA polymerase III subunit gamma/tau [Fannyhessea vaginae]|uniref:DNA polymerase III subunit gamma/tau n=1 Tax=Fannyhessea vaginae TaxID=82135 RepID=UPI0026EC6652|nr:DNA polymerase III subunit gamma/tau [Fannyhessea vaginae]